jgi:hypothetical protein
MEGGILVPGVPPRRNQNGLLVANFLGESSVDDPIEEQLQRNLVQNKTYRS